MERLPTEIFVRVCAELTESAFLCLIRCCRSFNEKSHAVTSLKYNVLNSRWYYTRKVEKIRGLSVCAKIQTKISLQRNWAQLDKSPVAFIPFEKQNYKVFTLLCRKNRCLILGNDRKLLVLDLESMERIAEIELPQYFHFLSSISIIWDGDDQVVAYTSTTLRKYLWNLHSNKLKALDTDTDSYRPQSRSWFQKDGNTLLDCSPKREVIDLNTLESKPIVLAKPMTEANEMNILPNVDWRTRTMLYQISLAYAYSDTDKTGDEGYYASQVNDNWEEQSSLKLNIHGYSYPQVQLCDDYVVVQYRKCSVIMSAKTGEVLQKFKRATTILRDKYLIVMYGNTLVNVFELRKHDIVALDWLSHAHQGPFEVLHVMDNNAALIKYEQTTALVTPNGTKKIVVNGNFDPSIRKLLPLHYQDEYWKVSQVLCTETQLVCHMHSYTENTAIIVLDFCDSVLLAD